MKKPRKPRNARRQAPRLASNGEFRQKQPQSPTSATRPEVSSVQDDSTASRDQASVIREELMRRYAPETQAEIELIAELAQARAEFFEIEKAWQMRIGQEKDTATQRFDRRAADAFDRDRSAWLKDPAGRVRLLGGTSLGSKFLAAIWRRVLDELQAGRALPFVLIREAAMALGSPWQADRATGQGLKLLVLYVCSSPDPAHASEIWAKESKVCDGLAFARDRIRQLLAEASPAADARDELINLARREAGQCFARAGAHRPGFEAARQAAADGAVGLGLGDAALEKELRLLNRYARQARDRAGRLQRQVERLLHSRYVINRRDARNSPKIAAPSPEIEDDMRLLFGDYAERAMANGFHLRAQRRQPCETTKPAAEKDSAPNQDESMQHQTRGDVASHFQDAANAPSGTHSGANQGMGSQRMPAETKSEDLYERHLRLLERYLPG